MDLGRAVYALIARRSPRRERTPREMVARALARAGGVSQLARAIGVSRTTVQRWNRGSTPTQESQELLRAVLRRADLSDARAARLEASNRLVVKGRQADGPGGKPRPRTVNLSPYLAPGTMGRAVEAYLRGASPADLHIVVWSGITDKHYRWMFQPPGGFAQQAPADRARDAGQAMAGGGGGGGGDPFATVGEWAGVDPEEWDDYVDDMAGEGWEVDDNDGYEFSVTGAR